MGQGKDNGRGKRKKGDGPHNDRMHFIPQQNHCPDIQCCHWGIGVYIYIYSASLYLLDRFWT